MNGTLSKLISNLVTILVVVVILIIAYSHYDRKLDKEEQQQINEYQINLEKEIISRIDSLMKMRDDTLKRITNNYHTIIKESGEQKDEIENTHNNDSLIAIYFRLRPDSLLFQ